MPTAKPRCDEQMLQDWGRRKRCTRKAMFRWPSAGPETLNYCTQHFKKRAKEYAETLWRRGLEDRCQHRVWEISHVVGVKHPVYTVVYRCKGCGKEHDYEIPSEPSWKMVDAIRDSGRDEYITSMIETMKERARL